uniref:Uncharacterized protein n=1 Tax=Arundo donax TaxID=35708 RepID=A0A0A9EIH8_ARUDO
MAAVRCSVYSVFCESGCNICLSQRVL